MVWPSGSKNVWLAVFGSDESEHERKIREEFKARFNGLNVIQDLYQSAAAEVKAKKYPQDIEDWLIAQLESLAAELRGQ